MAHQILMVFETADLLLLTSPDAPVFSGVRNTLRPAIQALHAAAALSFMVILCKNSSVAMGAHRATPWLRKQGQLMVGKLAKTLSELRNHCEFTTFGSILMNDLTAVSNISID
jgi:hypothetical protein